ncbi:hypothetical protein CHISP_2760 [Chitinispirillum alkaliphilum]|nr:hypothetical protein CHISP_2760 [Chitinispirillum alkaliphilum]
MMQKISKSQLEKLQKKYHSDSEIGALFGISRQAVHQIRKKHGIPPVQNKHSDRNQEIIQLYRKGIPGTKIAKMLKLSKTHTYRVISAENHKSDNQNSTLQVSDE